MNKLVLKMAASLILATSFSTFAQSATMSEMMTSSKDTMSCSLSCSADYGQCVKSATDLSLTSSAADILPRTNSNLSAGAQCNTDAIQCNKACY